MNQINLWKLSGPAWAWDAVKPAHAREMQHLGRERSPTHCSWGRGSRLRDPYLPRAPVALDSSLTVLLRPFRSGNGTGSPEVHTKARDGEGVSQRVEKLLCGLTINDRCGPKRVCHTVLGHLAFLLPIRVMRNTNAATFQSNRWNTPTGWQPPACPPSTAPVQTPVAPAVSQGLGNIKPLRTSSQIQHAAIQ